MESERTQEGSHCRNKQLLRRTQEIKRQGDERNVEETRKKRVIARVSQGKAKKERPQSSYDTQQTFYGLKFELTSSLPQKGDETPVTPQITPSSRSIQFPAQLLTDHRTVLPVRLHHLAAIHLRPLSYPESFSNTCRRCSSSLNVPFPQLHFTLLFAGNITREQKRLLSIGSRRHTNMPYPFLVQPTLIFNI